MYRKILLPLDGSASAETAVPVACDFAINFGAEIHLLCAFSFASPLFLGEEDSLPADLKKLKEHQRKQAESYLQKQAEIVRERGITVHCACKAEDARESICKYASQQEIDVIIMNSGERSGWMRWLTGSIAEEVLRSAPCPVLVLRPTTLPEE